MHSYSDRIKKFHTTFSKKYPEYYDKYNDSDHIMLLDRAEGVDTLVNSMVECVKCFCQKSQIEAISDTIILFVCANDETSVYDQYSLINQLYEKQ